MKLMCALVALMLATACASGPNHDEVALTSNESQFSRHQGRPLESKRTRAEMASPSSVEDDDSWLSSLIGDFIGGLVGAFFSKNDGSTPSTIDSDILDSRAG